MPVIVGTSGRYDCQMLHSLLSMHGHVMLCSTAYMPKVAPQKFTAIASYMLQNKSVFSLAT